MFGVFSIYYADKVNIVIYCVLLERLILSYTKRHKGFPFCEVENFKSKHYFIHYFSYAVPTFKEPVEDFVYNRLLILVDVIMFVKLFVTKLTKSLLSAFVFFL